jgi:hypothetical protein
MKLPNIKIFRQEISWSNGQVVVTYLLCRKTCLGLERILPYSYKTIWTLKEAKQIRLYYCKNKKLPTYENDGPKIINRYHEYC